MSNGWRHPGRTGALLYAAAAAVVGVVVTTVSRVSVERQRGRRRAAQRLPGGTDHRDRQPHELRRRRSARPGLPAPREVSAPAGDVGRVPRADPRPLVQAARVHPGRARRTRRRRRPRGRGRGACRRARRLACSPRDGSRAIRTVGPSAPRPAPCDWRCGPVLRSSPWRWSVLTRSSSRERIVFRLVKNLAAATTRRRAGR